MLSKAPYFQQGYNPKFAKSDIAFYICFIDLYSWLSRCSTARGSSSGLFLVGPTKVKAC